MFRFANGSYRFSGPWPAAIRRRLTAIAAVLVAVSVLVAGSASTDVAQAQVVTPDLVVLSGATVATGWEFRRDYGVALSVPTATGVTFTTGDEGAFRIVTAAAVSGYSTVELQFGASMANRSFTLTPLLGSTSGIGVAATANASGFATVTIPNTQMTMLYLNQMGVGTTINLQSVRLKTVSSPTTTLPGGGGGGSDLVVLSGATVATGWEFRRDYGVALSVPTASGVTFTTADEGAFRVVSSSAVSGFAVAEFQFGSSFANKSFEVQPFAGGVGGSVVSASTNGTGFVSVAIPSSSMTMLYLRGLGVGTTINLQSVRLKTVSSPTTTLPGGGGGGSDLVVLSGATVATGWEFRHDFGSSTVPAVAGVNGVTFTTLGEGAYRIVTSTAVSGFAVAEFQFGASMANKSFSLTPFSGGTGGAGISASTNASGFVSVAIPSSSMTMLYLSGLGVGVTINLQRVTLKPAGSTTGGGGGGGVTQTCQGRSGPIEVWPLGDSLTVGGYGDGGATHRDSYRFALHESLTATAGVPAFRFKGHTGQRVSAFYLADYDNFPGYNDIGFSHSGVGFISIEEVIAQMETFLAGPSGGSALKPDVVVVNLGTNEKTVPANIGGLVDKLKLLLPNSVIVLGTVPANQPEVQGSAVSANRAALRDRINAIGNASASDRIFTADVYSRMRGGSSPVVSADFGDATHFNTSGGTKFSSALYPEVLAAIRLSATNRCGTHSGGGGGSGGGGVTPDADGSFVVFDGASGGVKAGYVANIAAPVSGGVANQANYTFTGPSSGNTGAISVAFASASPVRIRVGTVNDPSPMLDTTVSSASTGAIHNYPFVGVPAGQTVTVSIFGAGPVQLRRLALVNRPFVTVDAPTTVATGAPVTIQIGLPWQAARLRLQKESEPTNCLVCGQTIDVTQGGGYTFGSPGPGLWKAVLFTNSPGETIGISDAFTVRQPTPGTSGNSTFAYRDGFQSGWENWSWAPNAPVATPAVGASSLSFEPDDWKGVIFHASQLPSNTTHLRFKAARAGAPGGSVSLRATVLSNKAVVLDQFFVVTSPTLTEYSWPLVNQATSGTAIDVQIQGYAAGNQDTVYIDEVELTNGAPPVTTAQPTTTTTRPPATTTTTTPTTTTQPPTTTTVPPTTTTTLPPLPVFNGAPAQTGGYGSAFTSGQVCNEGINAAGTLNGAGSLNIPPAVWTSSAVSFNGGVGQVTVDSIYVKVQFVNGAGMTDLVTQDILGSSTSIYLPSLPAGTRWVAGYELHLRVCIAGPGSQGWQIGPFVAGSGGGGGGTTVPPTTTPGTTTPPTSVPVTTTPPSPVVPGPDWARVPNYLKSDYSKVKATGSDCLGYGPGGTVVIVGCETAEAAVEFTRTILSPQSSDYDVVRLRKPAENRCLMMTNNLAVDIDPSTGIGARTAGWIDCNGGGISQNLTDSFFLERVTGTEWFTLRPLRNQVAMTNPCLSLNDGGIAKGFEVAIEYQCGGQDWQRWRPRLTSTPGGGGGGGNPPGSANDEEPLKLLTDNQLTAIHDPNRSICLSEGSAGFVVIGIYGSANCLIFQPIEGVDVNGLPTNARWDLFTGDRCLGRVGIS